MAEADAEDRLESVGPVKLGDVADGRSAHGRVSGSVADEKSVEFVAGEVVVPRHEVNPGPAFNQTPERTRKSG